MIKSSQGDAYHVDIAWKQERVHIVLTNATGNELGVLRPVV